MFHRATRFFPILLGGLGFSLIAQTTPPKTESPKPTSAVPAASMNGPSSKPFADVVKDAKEIPGLFNLWKTEDKLWIEVKPEQLDTPYFYQVNLSRGIGEKMLYGGMMLRFSGIDKLVTFHKQGQQMQLILKNAVAAPLQGEGIARAVTDGFSDSLLASAPIASQPHPERKSYLVEANALLYSDLPMVGSFLEQSYRQPYSFDARNTSIQKIRNTAEQTTLDLQAHFQAPKIMTPPPVPTPGAPVPTTPENLADPRSMFLGLLYSFRQLPGEIMKARLADDRLGMFSVPQLDFSESTDQAKDRKRHIITRWRLEKKHPETPLSEPKEPIVYWLDRNMPEKWRKPIEEGILEWNKAFERIGFKNAIQVKQQPLDADWDTLDARHASVRWLVGSDIEFAIGPSTVDPRSGEILDADVGFGENMVRRAYSVFKTFEDRKASVDFPSFEQREIAHAMADLDRATALLEARGELQGPEADAFVTKWMRFLAIHEVGHTLGFSHNFRASTIYTWEQLADPSFTRKHGHAGSVMEYLGTNLAPKGEKQGDPFMTTLGPYDYWIVEYAYKPIPPAEEGAELQRIASRSAEPQLAFGRDEEAHGGMDPEVNTWDIGPDPLEFARREAKIFRETIEVLEKSQLKAGESYEVLTRRFQQASGLFMRGIATAAKYVGGVVHLRDHAGTGRMPLNPVLAARQRESLDFLKSTVFSEDTFQLTPALLRKMTVDRTEPGPTTINADFDLPGKVLAMQRGILTKLLAPDVARRVLGAEGKIADPKQVFRLHEIYESLERSIWMESTASKSTSVLRQNLQKEHLRHLCKQLVQPAPDLPRQARSLARASLKRLGLKLNSAMQRAGVDPDTKAHVQDCLAEIEQAQKAVLQRSL